MTGQTEYSSVVASAVLTAAGFGVLAIAAFHVVCAIVGPPAYRYFGAGEAMASRAANGSAVPALVTLLLAAAFAVFGAYALSLAGRIRPLPLAPWVTAAIGLVFVSRGLLVVSELSKNGRTPGSVPTRFLFFSIFALLIGAMYLVGAISRWRYVVGRAGS